MAAKEHCTDCPSGTAILCCLGCKRYFCTKCYNKHRGEMVDELNKLSDERNTLTNRCSELAKTHAILSNLTSMIDEWETKTLNRVKSAAQRARHQAKTLVKQLQTDLSTRLDQLTKEILVWCETEDCMETDIHHVHRELKKLNDELNNLSMSNKMLYVTDNSERVDWDEMILVQSRYSNLSTLPAIPYDAKWSQNEIVLVENLEQPWGLRISREDGKVYVADHSGNKIISWDPFTKNTSVVTTDVKYPTDLLIRDDKKSIIIADFGNRRVIQYSLEQKENRCEILIENVVCHGLAMDKEGALYVCDDEKHEVRRFMEGDKTGVVVAGGNGKGAAPNQLDNPRFVVVDDDKSLYVTDWGNHRVMKWSPGSKEGVIVAGTGQRGNATNQLDWPNGIVIDQNGTLYIAECENRPITRWRKNERVGEVVVISRRADTGSPQLIPLGIGFDHDHNLYLTDPENHRLLKFLIEKKIRFIPEECPEMN